MALSQNATARLAEIAQATRGGGAAYSLNDDVLNELISANYVVTNCDLVQRDNISGVVVSIAARATVEGLAAYEQSLSVPASVNDAWGNIPTATVQPTATEVEPRVFEIDDYDELPEIERKRGPGIRPRTAVYPWERTPPGKRFFIKAEYNAKGQMIKHYSAANATNHRIRDTHLAAIEYNKTHEDKVTVPDAKHFRVFVVKAGQVIGAGTARPTVAPDDGEYVYCVPGLCKEITPRQAKPV
jgi:hypothetical protein